MILVLLGTQDHMAYEVFENKSIRFDSPSLSISPNGGMRLNPDAAAILKAAGAEQVLLLWDKGKHRIAISVVHDKDSRAYKLKYRSTGNGASFSAKAFAKHIGWKAGRFVALPLRSVDGMLEATLPSEHLTGSPKENDGGKQSSMRKNKTGL